MRDDTPAQHGTLLTVTLDAAPEVHLGEEEELGLRVRVTNQGEDPIDPATLTPQLRVDDLPPRALSLDGRGFGPLAPGQTLEWRERTRAIRLFTEPGDHTLRLEIGGAASEPIHVQVSE